MKTYRFAVRFGVATDTDDASGAVIATDDLRPDPAAIAAALGQFRGDILQVPPAFSAVKLAGQRAYDLARAGQAVDLAARPLFVQRLELIEMAEPDLAILEMVCGKGGYVRSIGRDLGRALGGVAHVAWLRRLQAGPFSLDHATTLARVEELARTPKIESLLLPISAALGDMPHLEASVAGAARLRCGNAGAVEMGDAAQGALVFVTHAGQALAIGRHLGGMVHPERVFNL